jgi:hypothetical protein
LFCLHSAQNICQVVEPSELLPQERPVVVALRWLSLMVFHAVDCILDKDKILGPDSVTSGTTSARRSSAASKEVPLHHAGLAMYKVGVVRGTQAVMLIQDVCLVCQSSINSCSRSRPPLKGLCLAATKKAEGGEQTC